MSLIAVDGLLRARAVPPVSVEALLLELTVQRLADPAARDAGPVQANPRHENDSIYKCAMCMKAANKTKIRYRGKIGYAMPPAERPSKIQFSS